MLTRKKQLVYTLVFQFGYDECELVGLTVRNLADLVIQLRVAEQTVKFNKQDPVVLPAGKLDGSVV